MPLLDRITTEFVGHEVRKDDYKEINSIMDLYLSGLVVRTLARKLESWVQVPVQDWIFIFQFYFTNLCIQT